MSKKIRQPPSGSIPRFPIWEVIILLILIAAGVVGLFTPDTRASISVLGSWSVLWNICFIGTGVIGLIGLALPAPTGLVVTIVSKVFLLASAGGALIGLIYYYGNFFFAGSISLYLFTFGALGRIIQILRQLHDIQRGVTHPWIPNKLPNM